MILEPPGIYPSYGNLGNATGRLSSHTCECQVSEIPVKSVIPISQGNRLSNPPMELQVGVHIPSNPVNCKGPVQAPEIFSHSNRCNPTLAKKTVVHDPIATQPSASNPSSGNPGSAISRPIPTPSSREVASDGLEVERARLREQGCS